MHTFSSDLIGKDKEEFSPLTICIISAMKQYLGLFLSTNYVYMSKFIWRNEFSTCSFFSTNMFLIFGFFGSERAVITVDFTM